MLLVAPVPTLTTSTLAPGTAAPFGSVTCPTREPYKTCACVAVGASRRDRTNRTTNEANRPSATRPEDGSASPLSRVKWYFGFVPLGQAVLKVNMTHSPLFQIEALLTLGALLLRAR